MEAIQTHPVKGTKTKVLQDYPESLDLIFRIISDLVDEGNTYTDIDPDTMEVVIGFNMPDPFNRTDKEGAALYEVDLKHYKRARVALEGLGFIHTTSSTKRVNSEFRNSGTTYTVTNKLLNVRFVETSKLNSKSVPHKRKEKKKTEKEERDLKKTLSLKKLSITPTGKFLKVLDPLPFTSRGKYKTTKPFSERSDKVRNEVFRILEALLLESFKLHQIEQTKRPHLGFPYFSKEDGKRLVGGNWNIVKNFLRDHGIIEPYVNKGKESYSAGNGVDKHGKAFEKHPKRWRIKRKFYSTQYFEFQPIEGLPKDSVTLHESIDEHFDEIVKLREWNKHVEFAMRHLVHTFNYRPINKTHISQHGRVFHKANNLPKELREFVLIDNTETETLDYSACSLTILYPLITTINGEQTRWKQMLDHPDGAYQYIADATGHTREEVKDDVVRWVGCRGQNTRWVNYIMNKFLKEHFPITYVDIQHGDIDLVAYTQKVESNIIVKTLGHKGLSIHDAIITKHHDTEEVHHLMKIIMGHFTSGKGVDQFTEFDLLFSDAYKDGVTGKPKLEEKVIRKLNKH